LRDAWGGLKLAEIIPFPTEIDAPFRVLVVDDEPAIRGVLCEFLQECGLAPVAVENADQALAVLDDSEPVDLVFSDVRMPGNMDGYGLARWVLKHRPQLPVILATGDLGAINAAGVGLSGVETFAKPYDFDMAVRKIRDTILHRQARRA
jgi:DNA-binding NtrC family response regulator